MAPKQNSSDEKLDLILQKMSSIELKVSAIEVRQENLEQLVNRVAQLENKVQDHDSTFTSMQREIKFLKETVNTQDQAKRGDTLRLFNFPGSNDEVDLPARVYETILKLILAAAKTGGDLQTLPHLTTICTDIFRAGKFSPGQNKPPPPVIVKFSSLPARLAILKNKRQNMPPAPEGAKRYVIVENLSPPTYRKLQEYQQDERISKAWTINRDIWVVPVRDNKKPKKVKSNFDSVDAFFS